MQVLLIKDVDNLGYAGDVKKVKDGFGRNYLLPQGLAVIASPGALKQAEVIKKAGERRRAQERADAEAIANQLSGLELLFERRAGETGKLYGSVTSGDIADAILEKTGIEIDKRKVALAEPIRELGKQDVTLKLMIELSTTLQVEVLPLGGILERERLSEAEVAVIEAEAEGVGVEDLVGDAQVPEPVDAEVLGQEPSTVEAAEIVEPDEDTASS